MVKKRGRRPITLVMHRLLTTVRPCLAAPTLVRYRTAFATLALLALAAAVARPLPSAAPDWGRPLVLAAGLFLLAHWIVGAKRARFPRPLVLLELAAVLVFGALHGLQATLGIVWCGLFFRPLYGTRVDAALSGAAIIGGLVMASLIISNGAVGAALGDTDLGLQLPNMVIVVAVMHSLARSLDSHARLLAATRHDAVTDALTGLGNRRALLEDLVTALQRPDREHVLALFDLDGFKGYNDAFGHAAGDLLLTRLGHALSDAVQPAGCAYRLGGDEFCVLLPLSDEDAAPVLEQATNALTECGELFHIGSSRGSVVLPREACSPADALRITDERMYANKRSGRRSAARQAKDALVRALMERNGQIAQHGEHVADLAHRTALALGLDDDTCERLRHAAELHDIGKVAIPDAILNKPGPLDASEWEFMRRHTTIGERILAAAPDLVGVARIVRSTHEAFDGTGYPDGLAGTDIPIEARITFACDAFDVMTTDRPYHRALSRSAAVAELQRCAGTQFDPEVITAFVRALEQTNVHAAQLPSAA